MLDGIKNSRSCICEIGHKGFGQGDTKKSAAFLMVNVFKTKI